MQESVVQDVGEELPDSIRKRFGNLSIEKGCTEDGLVRLYQWDAISDCTMKECPAYKLCDIYARGKCRVMQKYMLSLVEVVYRNYADRLTEPLLYKIGMHLLPLYRQLCKMKIEELGVERVTVQTARGGVQAHPIYKEIRETIKLISLLWHDLQLPVSEMPAAPDKNLFRGSAR